MGYKVIWEPPYGVVKIHFGQLSGADLLAAVVEVESRPDFDRLRYVINDFLDCTGLACTPDDLLEIAALDKAAARSNPNIRIAVVARHPDVLTLADDYADSPLNVYPTRTFSSLSEARTWLNIR